MVTLETVNTRIKESKGIGKWGRRWLNGWGEGSWTAGVVPKANAIHAKVAWDKHLLNRAHQLCHSTTPTREPAGHSLPRAAPDLWLTGCLLVTGWVMEGGVVWGSPRSRAVSCVLSTWNYLKTAKSIQLQGGGGRCSPWAAHLHRFIAWQIPWRRSLEGCSPWGR